MALLPHVHKMWACHDPPERSTPFHFGAGKSSLAQQLASRFNMPNVLQTDMFYEVCPSHWSVSHVAFAQSFQNSGCCTLHIMMSASRFYPIMMHWRDTCDNAHKWSPMQPRVFLVDSQLGLSISHFALCRSVHGQGALASTCTCRSWIIHLMRLSASLPVYVVCLGAQSTMHAPSFIHLVHVTMQTGSCIMYHAPWMHNVCYSLHHSPYTTLASTHPHAYGEHSPYKLLQLMAGAH